MAGQKITFPDIKSSSAQSGFGVYDDVEVNEYEIYADEVDYQLVVPDESKPNSENGTKTCEPVACSCLQFGCSGGDWELVIDLKKLLVASFTFVAMIFLFLVVRRVWRDQNQMRLMRRTGVKNLKYHDDKFSYLKVRTSDYFEDKNDSFGFRKALNKTDLGNQYEVKLDNLSMISEQSSDIFSRQQKTNRNRGGF